jgi:hypothetical protein
MVRIDDVALLFERVARDPGGEIALDTSSLFA